MSLEKRLPFVLLLMFVVLFGTAYLNAENGPDPQDGEGSEQESELAPSESSEEDPQADTSQAAPDVEGPTVEPAPEATAAESWFDQLELGREGERGHYFVRFDSLGGTLTELRTGSYWTEVGLSEEEKDQLENRVPILTSVKFLGPDGRIQSKGALTLRPGPSAQGVLPADLDKVHWHHEVLREADGSARGVRFWYDGPTGVRVTKTIARVPGEYHLAVTLGLENRGSEGKRSLGRFVLTVAEATPALSGDGFYIEPKAVAATEGGSPKQKSRSFKGGKKLSDNLVSGDIAYVGAHNKYFAAVLRASDVVAQETLKAGEWRFVFDGEWAGRPGNSRAEGYRYVAADATLELVVPGVGEAAREWSYVMFVGPKDKEAFSPDDAALGEIIREDLGFFDGIAGMILRFLRFLHGIFGNWGISIIVLTLCVRLMLFPLNRRMQTSMARHATKMKRIQPKIDAVKEKYKDNPKRLREEQAKIIQTEGAIPPLGGCLPVFLQIPIFFGLFSALRVAFDLRQQPFMGWIKDLAQPDRLAHLGIGDLWIIDLTYLNILPILMVVLWIGQQKVMPKPTDPQAAQMHKLMMWMPIAFGFFLYEYAAGLSLYMITTSLFGIAEFTVIRRIWPIDDREQPKKQGGFLAKLAELQEQAQKMQEQQGKQGGRGPKGGGGGRRR